MPKMEVTAAKLLIAALIISFLTLVFAVVGVAIPYWAYFSNSVTTAARGLWHLCDIQEDRETLDCFKTYQTVPAYIHAVRALEIAGIACMVLAVGYGALNICVWKERKNLAKYAGVLSCAAGTLILLGIVVFAAKFADELDAVKPQYSLSGGFGLCATSGILAIVAGALFFAAFWRKRRT